MESKIQKNPLHSTKYQSKKRISEDNHGNCIVFNPNHSKRNENIEQILWHKQIRKNSNVEEHFVFNIKES